MARSAITRALWTLPALLVALFLVGPIALLVLFSFTAGEIAAFPMEGPSLRWWREVAADPAVLAAAWNSLRIGAAVSLLSATFGTLAALGLARMRPGRAQAMLAALALPLMLPPLVLGVALLSFYVAVGVRLGLPTVILSQLLVTLPFVVLIVYARLRSFDWTLVDGARDLGATPVRAFWTVTFPSIRPSVVGAGLLALALSLDDFVITFFTIGSGNTLPTVVWGMIRTSLTPAANAIGTLVVLATVALAALALRRAKF